MRLSQILFEVPSEHSSGANIRNAALSRALSVLGDVRTLHVQNYGPSPTWQPSRGLSFVDAKLGAEMVDRIVSDVLKANPDIITVEGVFLAEVADALLAKKCQ